MRFAHKHYFTSIAKKTPNGGFLLVIFNGHSVFFCVCIGIGALVAENGKIRTTVKRHTTNGSNSIGDYTFGKARTFKKRRIANMVSTIIRLNKNAKILIAISPYKKFTKLCRGCCKLSIFHIKNKTPVRCTHGDYKINKSCSSQRGCRAGDSCYLQGRCKPYRSQRG